MVEKKNKIKKIKNERIVNEEQQEVFRFLKILFIVLLLIIVVYFSTRFFVKRDLGKEEQETSVTEVDHTKMVFGTMLNRKEESYYVFAFSSKNLDANYYGALASKYSSLKDSLYVYYIDLEDSMNKEFVSKDGKTNPNAKSVSELSVGELTLIKVEKGKIAKYLETLSEIEAEFAVK